MLMPCRRNAKPGLSLKPFPRPADETVVEAVSRNRASDLATLRERLDDLGRRRVTALERPTVPLSASERQRLAAMRFELAEAEWHLARLESH
jgi:hypothetical protein